MLTQLPLLFKVIPSCCVARGQITFAGFGQVAFAGCSQALLRNDPLAALPPRVPALRWLPPPPPPLRGTPGATRDSFVPEMQLELGFLGREGREITPQHSWGSCQTVTGEFGPVMRFHLAFEQCFRVTVHPARALWHTVFGVVQSPEPQ